MTALPGGLQKRGDIYVVRYRHNGTWSERRVGTDLDRALEVHAKLRPAPTRDLSAGLPKGIFKRGDSYYVRWKSNGRWRSKGAGRELGAAIDLQARLQDGEPDPDAVKLSDLVDRYIRRLETYFKPSTVKTHRTVARTLLRFFGERPVETWTSNDLEGRVALE